MKSAFEITLEDKDKKKGQAAAVPVIFQTTGGQVPSGVVYTYLGEPLPPNIVVWPPPVPGKQPWPIMDTHL